MIQLVVTDLDGTLLNDNKELPSNFWGIEKKLRELGIVFAVASGRPYESMRRIFNNNLEHILFIAENGGLIRYRGEELRSNALPLVDVHELIKLSRKLDNTHILLCGKDVMWFESQDETFLAESLKYYDHMHYVPDLLSVSEPIIKFTLCDMVSSETNSFPKLKYLQDKYTMAVSGLRWLDITGIDVNKGKALEFMQGFLGIPKENTLAFGDYFNDVEMLKQAGISFAMKNAHPEVRKMAQSITRYTNNEFGVIKEIEHLLKFE
ncbi:MAG: HAD family hydrolase [Bacteroidia bacterium]